MKTTYSIGIDLHKEVLQVCVLDGHGEVIEEKRHRVESLDQGLAVVEQLGRWKTGGRYVVEAVGMNRWFVNACRERGYTVVVADPVKLNLRMLGKKTDRRDSQELARRLLLGDIDRNATTYYPTEEEYGKRKLLRTRHKLVMIRQQVVNQIRGLCNAYKIPIPGVIWSLRSLNRLKTLSLSTEALTQALNAWATTLETLQRSIQELSRQVAQIVQEPKLASVQAVLPGVGPLTLATLVYEFGDLTRFRNAPSVASYAGLVPRVANSADVSHHGRLTKRGNPELRWIVGQWALRLLVREPEVRDWAAPRLKRMHKNKVRVTLARRLLIGVYHMLRTGEIFSLSRCLAA